jgi:hypothetical protein
MYFSKLIITAVGLLVSTVAAKCTCSKVSNPGLYCGYCAEVLTGWTSSHVYECAKSGACSDYGVSSYCKGSGYYCDGRDSWKVKSRRDPFYDAIEGAAKPIEVAREQAEEE